jgi:hypothetical protein
MSIPRVKRAAQIQTCRGEDVVETEFSRRRIVARSLLELKDVEVIVAINIQVCHPSSDCDDHPPMATLRLVMT